MWNRLITYGYLIGSVLLLAGCESGTSDQRFKLVPPEQSKIAFNNKIWETEDRHYFSFAYLYNGGGVGVGDFNNDGLEDVFFSGNLVPSKLYLNKGDFVFEDITEKAGILPEGWDNGVSVVDINQDGWLDIYVSVGGFAKAEDRRNKLYINNGDATFTEAAKAYGLDDDGFSTQAAFFDYDRDGDLDMYLLRHANENTDEVEKLYTLKDGSGPSTDQLYRNKGVGENGHPTFENVSAEAGILTEGYGLGVAIVDINQDGWPDVYVANDFLASDLLYINNQNGTFTDKSAAYFSHTTRNSMGIEVADLTNDGLLDIFVLDMLPEDNERQKTMTSGMDYQHFRETLKKGFHPQFIRNVLQLNRGMDAEGNPIFSEVGRLAGLHETDWSWCPLAADFDNDGRKDIYITNGFRRNITDHDFQEYSSQQQIFQKGTGKMREAKVVKRIRELDSIFLPNYMFRNLNDLQFKNMGEDWGLTSPSLSNGSAYADFDNDGDLDLVVNNINAPAFLYQNQSKNNHYIQLDLKGKANNKDAFGSKVSIYLDNGELLYQEKNPVKGFMSTSQQKLHFGLPESAKVDSVIVHWPGDRRSRFIPQKLDTVYRLDIGEAIKWEVRDREAPKTLFKEVTDNIGFEHRHVENKGNDFIHEPLLLHQYDYSGPTVAVADGNGDGLDDFYIGGSRGNSGQLFFQLKDGSFTPKFLDDELKYEDGGALFFDADDDGDLDLYVVSGGSAVKYFEKGHYQDRLYINDGKGNFAYDEKALPTIEASGSCVVASDYDGDGDLDLFVGGRVVPGSFPLAPRSYLLRNDKGKFTDVTRESAPQLAEMGMVSSALWSDIDNDNDTDLLVVGEYMPVSVFVNNGGVLEPLALSEEIVDTKGWWNSIAGGDFDNDGDVDYILGNLGQNNAYKVTKEEPLRIYAKDFDGNSSIDAIATRFIKGKEVSIAPRNLLASQLNSVKKIFRSYNDFAKSDIHDLLAVLDSSEIQVLEANEFASMYLENKGRGEFAMKKLPLPAQYSALNGLQVGDFNEDGNLDVMALGNLYPTEVISGYIDGGKGLVLKGDGKGGFSEISLPESGFYVPGDSRALARLVHATHGNLLIATVNSGKTKLFSKGGRGGVNTIKWPKNAHYGVLELTDGRRRKFEKYYGEGYLTQSSPIIEIPKNCMRTIFYDLKGEKILEEKYN
ncbi:VCBS repeat-containing protein [Pseudozobellia thermophila]|uniref:Repeat domain-containing protein n=1 Tax=Pseudozobellia thermophila TaxID=192903 RepID=A0A1M6GKQ0_9FLAO|nr:VCBS repeat-containing protein [Pseudozobellia thermophila]SHJ10537.1 Repeat domain-containing protein [Pseudozobellia thermophila]